MLETQDNSRILHKTKDLALPQSEGLNLARQDGLSHDEKYLF
jgi:hypothetical protein